MQRWILAVMVCCIVHRLDNSLMLPSGCSYGMVGPPNPQPQAHETLNICKQHYS